MTMLLSFSLTLPLLHFFFFERPPANAAFNLASLDFCTTLFAPMTANAHVTWIPWLPLLHFFFFER